MSAFCRIAAAVFGMWLAGAEIARATTAEGTLITNSASITYSLSTGVGVTMSYAVTAAVAVTHNPTLSVQKFATPSTLISGGTLTFRIWISNSSPVASAFNVIAIDRLPDNTSYAGNYSSWPGGVGVWSVERSANGSAYGAGEPPFGQAPTYYLRWVLNTLGISRSAYVQYSARVL